MNRSNRNNYLNILGLAYRARKCSTGENVIIEDIRTKKVKLLIIACDISDGTRKKLIDKCITFHVPYMEVDEDRYTIAQAIGKNDRVAIAILDDGFAKKIITLLS